MKEVENDFGRIISIKGDEFSFMDEFFQIALEQREKWKTS